MFTSLSIPLIVSIEHCNKKHAIESGHESNYLQIFIFEPSGICLCFSFVTSIRIKLQSMLTGNVSAWTIRFMEFTRKFSAFSLNCKETQRRQLAKTFEWSNAQQFYFTIELNNPNTIGIPLNLCRSKVFFCIKKRGPKALKLETRSFRCGFWCICTMGEYSDRRKVEHVNRDCNEYNMSERTMGKWHYMVDLCTNNRFDSLPIFTLHCECHVSKAQTFNR